jgi:HlyD family secretion protein
VGSERAGSVAAARAGVDVAQSNLEQLTADPRDFEIDSVQASIRRAEAELEQAELEISKTTLRTPLAGTVAAVNLQVGEAPDASAPAVVVADLSGFYVTITVDEIDVARLEVDQPARLTLDALPELELEGVVDRINPLATEGAAVTSYEVRLRTRGNEERVRSGMSTNADIIVERKTEALIVPRRAVYTDDGDLFVDLPADQTLCEADQATWPIAPELRAVPVEVGLRNDLAIEIVGGDLDEQSCIYIEGFDARMQPLTGPPPSNRGR